MKHYTIKQDYFEKIDTQEKAYILGFLYADGNNYIKNYHQVTLELSEIDKEILLKMKKELKFDKPLKYRKETFVINHNKKYKIKPKNGLIICNKKISQDLLNLGLMPNKTLKLKFPNEKQVPNHLLRHFVRGYFDGDGCITFYKVNEYKKYKVGMVGNSDFIKKLNIFLLKNDIIFCIHKIKSTNFKIWESYTGGNLKVKKFLDWLYEDANLSLKRKREKYVEFKKYVNYTD